MSIHKPCKDDVKRRKVYIRTVFVYKATLIGIHSMLTSPDLMKQSARHFIQDVNNRWLT